MSLKNGYIQIFSLISLIFILCGLVYYCRKLNNKKYYLPILNNENSLKLPKYSTFN